LLGSCKIYPNNFRNRYKHQKELGLIFNFLTEMLCGSFFFSSAVLLKLFHLSPYKPGAFRGFCNEFNESRKLKYVHIWARRSVTRDHASNTKLRRYTPNYEKAPWPPRSHGYYEAYDHPKQTEQAHAQAGNSPSPSHYTPFLPGQR